MRQWFFEDFVDGQTLPPGELVVGPEDAAWFATRFSPLVIEAADWRSGDGRGGECLSEWYVAALGMRMIWEAFLHHTMSLGSPGIEEVECTGPVRVEDRLRLDGRISSLRASRSRPDMGIVGFDFAMMNQHGACVMRQRNVILVQRRREGVEP